MKSFNYFLNEEYLEESLNTPIEFYLTDDTKLPKEIFGSYNIDGVDYGISLVETKYDKVYMLDLYRIVNVKKRSWSFINQKHIRPSLSTVIKFVEACYPFIQQRVEGIIIEIPGKVGSEKYSTLLSKIIARSYIKKFRAVPIQKTTDKANNYIFMIKKGVEPTKLFKTATFWKNFQFDIAKAKTAEAISTIADVSDFDKFWNDVNNGLIPSDVLDTAATPYKIMRQTVKLAPSKKYAFGKIEMEVAAGQDLIDQLEAASMKQKPVEKKEVKFEDILATKGYVNTKTFKKEIDYAEDSIFYPIVLIMTKAAGIIWQHGFDESKFNFDNFKYAFREGFNLAPSAVKKELVATGVCSANGEWLMSQDDAKFVLTLIGEAKSSSIVDTYTGNLANYMGYSSSVKEAEQEYEIKKSQTITNDSFKSLDWNVQPTIDDPLMADYNTLALDTRFDISSSMAETRYKNARKYLLDNNPEVAKFYNNVDTSSPYYQSMKEYTGSAYSNRNSNLREILSAFLKGKSGFKLDDIYDSNIDGFKFFLEMAPKLSKPMWVIRNMDIPSDLMSSLEVGGEFIDTAFLSTTIKTNVTMGYANGRMKIYLPAGTPIFPALESHSNHSSEKEIVLPPASVMKITKSLDIQSYSSKLRMFEAVYIGNGLKDMYNRIQSGKGFIEEQKVLKMSTKISKQEQESLKAKYALPEGQHDSISKEDMEAFIKLMKKGTIKLDTASSKK